MNDTSGQGLLLLQIVSISIAGAVAVICYLLSLWIQTDVGDTLRAVAYVAAGICAVIGVSFAFTGSRR